MSKDRYKLEASGSTTKRADKALDKERKGLLKIFQKAQDAYNTNPKNKRNARISDHLSITSHSYEAQLTLKPMYESEDSDFTVVSRKGWDELNAKIAEETDTPKAYATVYTVKQYLNLSTLQKQAAEGRKLTPPAGRSRAVVPSRDITSFLGM